MEKEANVTFFAKNIRLVEFLAVIVPLVVWIGGLNLTSFETMTVHTEQIKNLQTESKEEKQVRKELQDKLDDKFDKIQADLSEIKLILKDKVDKKN
jgi:uncharacterized membrane protein (DUF106 family)